MKKNTNLLILGLILSALFYSCGKETSYENNIVPGGLKATGTIEDSSGNCLPIVVRGTYYNGIAVSGDTDYVQLTINVKTTGSYSIQTPLANGMQFSGTGVFNSTGLQVIHLKGSGTPVKIATTNFNIGLGGLTCPFTVSVEDSTGHSSGNNNSGGSTDTSSIALNKWQFVANGHTYSGNMMSSLYVKLASNYTFFGSMASGSKDTAFGIQIQFPGSSLDTGSFPTSSLGNNFSLQFATGANAGNIIYESNALYQQTVNIVVSSYNSSTKVISGIFYGQAYDANDSTVNISNGKFKATVTSQ
ncbi:MAG: hypothetical protein JST58_15740 [Bacteroidetes bacterium]|nr:hypothetical protein [Bacteroidota bacterium]